MKNVHYPLTSYSSLLRSVVLNSTSTVSAINFNEDDILKIIRSLNINKAHGHGDISVRIIKACDKAIFKPLIYLPKIYWICHDTDMFAELWKKTNTIPVYK